MSQIANGGVSLTERLCRLGAPYQALGVTWCERECSACRLGRAFPLIELEAALCEVGANLDLFVALLATGATAPVIRSQGGLVRRRRRGEVLRSERAVAFRLVRQSRCECALIEARESVGWRVQAALAAIRQHTLHGRRLHVDVAKESQRAVAVGMLGHNHIVVLRSATRNRVCVLTLPDLPSRHEGHEALGARARRRAVHALMLRHLADGVGLGAERGRRELSRERARDAVGVLSRGCPGCTIVAAHRPNNAEEALEHRERHRGVARGHSDGAATTGEALQRCAERTLDCRHGLVIFGKV